MLISFVFCLTMKVILIAILSFLAALQGIQCKPVLNTIRHYADFQQDSDNNGGILRHASSVLPKITSPGDKTDHFDFSKISAIMNYLAMNELAQELEDEQVAQEEEADLEITEEPSTEDLPHMLYKIAASKIVEKIVNEG